MNTLILFTLLIIVVISLLNMQFDKGTAPTKSRVAPKQAIESIPQAEIQEPSYIDAEHHANDYPYPQISRSFKQLSRGELPSPIQNLKDILPSNGPNLSYIRSSDKGRMYVPDYYRKDRLSQNPIGSSELRPFTLDDMDSDQSWTDENVSEHPKFYSAEIKDEITNIGAFFDNNNQYSDKSSANTNSLTTDSCYIDKNGTEFCEDNTRLQLIPPRTINNPKRSTALTDIGLYNDTSNRKVMNGHTFFESVTGKKGFNESMSKPIETELGSCSF